MQTLLVPDLRTLRRLLTRNIVPASVSQFPVLVHLDPLGQYRLQSSVTIPDDVIFEVVRHGGRLLADPAPIYGVQAGCWQQLIPLEAEDPFPAANGEAVLFDLSAGELPHFAGEIDRLAPQPLEWAFAKDDDGDDTHETRVWVRVLAPPYVTWSRTLERGQNASAYIECARRVWVRLGYRHPLADQILVPEGKRLFLRPECDWELVEDRLWVAGVKQFTLPRSSARPVQPADPSDAGLPASLGVDRLSRSLRLVPTSTPEKPELWAFSVNALTALSELVRTSDDRLLSKLSFAAFTVESQPTVLLRARPDKGLLPILVPDVIPFEPLLKLANLFIPCRHRLHTPPRRDVLRRLLAPDDSRLTWLRPLPDGSFRPESLPLKAFHPLAEWVRYCIDAPPNLRRGWIAGDGSFERFSIRAESSTIPASRPEAAELPTVAAVATPLAATGKPTLMGRVLGWLKPRKSESATEDAVDPLPMAEAVSNALQFPQEPIAPSPSRVTEIRQRSERLESRFLKELPHLASEQRLEGWPDLAGVYGQLNNHVDAAICWINALWERNKPSSLWAWGWLRAEATQARWKPSDADLGQFLALPSTPERTRTLAAYVVWGTLQQPTPRGLSEHLGPLQSQLDAHESHLSIRGAWLAKLGLARLAQGDVLSLARTRDRLLDRLRHRGLTVDLDLPAFLQFNEAGAGNRLQFVRHWLRSRQEPLHRWITALADPNERQEPAPASVIALERCGLKPEIDNTCAYADLMLAWGLARLRYAEDVDPLVERARRKLDGGDPVHALLLEGFVFRIRSVREGKPPNEPMPSSWLENVEKLPMLERYRVDKLRQHSGILGASDRSEAYWASIFRHSAGWDGFDQTSTERPGLDVRLPAPSIQPVAQARGLILAVDSIDRLTPTLAENTLQQLASALDRTAGNFPVQIPLMERAFHAAGRFDRIPLARTLLGQFTRLIDEVRVTAELPGIDSLTGRMVDCLRRLGLRRELDSVLNQLFKSMLRGQSFAQARAMHLPQWAAILRTCTHIAAGRNACDKADEAHGMMEEIRQDLYGGSLTPRDRTTLALVYAQRLAEVSFQPALGRFEEMFQRLRGIALTGTTNTHYTLQPLELIDTMIRGIVHHNFSLAPTVRNWLIDDEQRVRQRIQSDFEEMLRAQKE